MSSTLKTESLRKREVDHQMDRASSNRTFEEDPSKDEARTLGKTACPRGRGGHSLLWAHRKQRQRASVAGEWPRGTMEVKSFQGMTGEFHLVRAAGIFEDTSRKPSCMSWTLCMTSVERRHQFHVDIVLSRWLLLVQPPPINTRCAVVKEDYVISSHQRQHMITYTYRVCKSASQES